MEWPTEIFDDGLSEMPTVVCLCGSTKFKAEFLAAQKAETLAGKIVLTVGFYGHADQDPPTEEQKVKLDALHKRKIEMADEILVLNVAGYIGSSTRGEIEHAREVGVRVRWAYPTLIPLDLHRRAEDTEA